jgi:hypothetical protein
MGSASFGALPFLGVHARVSPVMIPGRPCGCPRNWPRPGLGPIARSQLGHAWFEALPVRKWAVDFIAQIVYYRPLRGYRLIVRDTIDFSQTCRSCQVDAWLFTPTFH